MSNLEEEKRSSILIRYLDDPQFQQGLPGKQEALNKAIAAYLEGAIRAEGESKKSGDTAIGSFLFLKHVRTLIWNILDVNFAMDRPRGDFEIFKRILQEADRTVEGWGGQLVIVYLPAPFRYPGQYQFSNSSRRLLDHIHARLLTLTQELGIPVIDVIPSFPDAPPPESGANAKFFYPYFAHYTPEGYQAVGRTILNGLSSLPIQQTHTR